MRRLALLICALIALPAFAKPLVKSVTLEWEPIEDAAQYDLEIRKGRETIVQKRLEKPKWKGELTAGAYLYQVRAVDSLATPGEWSGLQALAILPPSPAPVQPEDGSALELYDPKIPIELRWNPVDGVAKFEIELKRDGKAVQSSVVTATRFDAGALPEGKYSWTVKSVIEDGKKRWSAPPLSTEEFKVSRLSLAKPKPVDPEGKIAPPRKGEKLRLRWKSVSGAEAYEVRLVRRLAGRSIAADLKNARSFVVKDTEAFVPVSGDGSYTWQVRALANYDDKKSPLAAGPESVSDFQLDGNALFDEGGGYAAVSTMFAPYSYKVISPSTGFAGSAQSAAFTTRVSGEVWLSPHIGASGSVEDTFFTLQHQQFQRLAFELSGKYRSSLDGTRSGWIVAPKAGIEARQYLAITPNATSGLTSVDLMAYGATIGVDVRKQLNTRWSLGTKVSYFLPFTMTARGTSIKPEGGASFRNISAGAQAVYWLGGGFALNAGGFVEARSIGYSSTASSVLEEVRMDGFYFFGSVIYTFGR